MPSRRQILSLLAAAPVLAPIRAYSAAPAQLVPTPSCADDDDLTPSQTEGPFFTPNSPEKQDFASEAPGGERITIAGYVLTQDCRRVAKALVELWHADETGKYDNDGYKLRGHQFSDAEGRWWFNTVVPGLYPGRTRHFHVKVQRPGARILTTQLYFPGEPGNAVDTIFNDALLLDVTSGGDGKFGRYDFVVR
ncbi:intradiol ring-cleavage dioxygenase [Mesorhizobium sp. L-8-10]|uniref:dioxygenase family protein n=1 Tax=unclassified Mesorhizobium TaxID=325217 RepID=UPI00192781D7|nr:MULTISPECIES: intradiol ring-cleavage dioxygenase [unclassified Mesorhizobium]BCH21966.1 intradiol ring-cleavage dioxygenase [Mesorhizobium sp. L-8-3]BCH29660.1 intradiol ring-cleavage dioxygenase [Mesorhizobium sp. L-8-10]